MKKYSLIYIAKLSFPIFLANVAIPLVGIIDTSLMGNLGNISYLTATSIAANLFSMIFWSFGFLKMGTVGMVSQAHGENNYSKILDILLRNLFFVINQDMFHYIPIHLCCCLLQQWKVLIDNLLLLRRAL